MNDDDDRQGWRRVAIGTMTVLFTALFVFAALADRFLSRFMPVFVGLMLVALVLYTGVVGSIRVIQRLRRRQTPSAAAPRSESEVP